MQARNKQGFASAFARKPLFLDGARSRNRTFLLVAENKAKFQVRKFLNHYVYPHWAFPTVRLERSGAPRRRKISRVSFSKYVIGCYPIANRTNDHQAGGANCAGLTGDVSVLRLRFTEGLG
jgi:hypothetical protein